jgi:hypothetical protein
MTEKPSCAICSAFNAMAKQCRRKSPELVTVNGPAGLQFMGTWPGTSADHWCLEFIPDKPQGVIAS